MEPSEFWYAFVRFKENPQSGKWRGVIVIRREPLNDGSIIVLAGTSKEKPAWRLLHEIDFTFERYPAIWLSGHRGLSRFYYQRWIAVPAADFEAKRRGVIKNDDMREILLKLGLISHNV